MRRIKKRILISCLGISCLMPLCTQIISCSSNNSIEINQNEITAQNLFPSQNQTLPNTKLALKSINKQWVIANKKKIFKNYNNINFDDIKQVNASLNNFKYLEPNEINLLITFNSGEEISILISGFSSLEKPSFLYILNLIKEEILNNIKLNSTIDILLKEYDKSYISNQINKAISLNLNNNLTIQSILDNVFNKINKNENTNFYLLDPLKEENLLFNLENKKIKANSQINGKEFELSFKNDPFNTLVPLEENQIFKLDIKTTKELFFELFNIEINKIINTSLIKPVEYSINQNDKIIVENSLNNNELFTLFKPSFINAIQNVANKTSNVILLNAPNKSIDLNNVDFDFSLLKQKNPDEINILNSNVILNLFYKETNNATKQYFGSANVNNLKFDAYPNFDLFVQEVSKNLNSLQYFQISFLTTTINDKLNTNLNAFLENGVPVPIEINNTNNNIDISNAKKYKSIFNQYNFKLILDANNKPIINVEFTNQKDVNQKKEIQLNLKQLIPSNDFIFKRFIYLFAKNSFSMLYNELILNPQFKFPLISFDEKNNILTQGPLCFFINNDQNPLNSNFATIFNNSSLIEQQNNIWVEKNNSKINLNDWIFKNLNFQFNTTPFEIFDVINQNDYLQNIKEKWIDYFFKNINQTLNTFNFNKFYLDVKNKKYFVFKYNLINDTDYSSYNQNYQFAITFDPLKITYNTIDLNGTKIIPYFQFKEYEPIKKVGNDFQIRVYNFKKGNITNANKNKLQIYFYDNLLKKYIQIPLPLNSITIENGFLYKTVKILISSTIVDSQGMQINLKQNDKIILKFDNALSQCILKN